jgi:hypothetical protein
LTIGIIPLFEKVILEFPASATIIPWYKQIPPSVSSFEIPFVSLAAIQGGMFYRHLSPFPRFTTKKATRKTVNWLGTARPDYFRAIGGTPRRIDRQTGKLENTPQLEHLLSPA